MNDDKRNEANKQNKQIRFSEKTATFEALKTAENKNNIKNNKTQ